MSDTALFFHTLAPALVANILTVVFVYSFARISQQERSGIEEGRLTYLWLIVMVFLFMLYGLHTWGMSPWSSAAPMPGGGMAWISGTIASTRSANLDCVALLRG